jgi:Putative DNA-binding domain
MDGNSVVLSLRELQLAFCGSITGFASNDLLSLIVGDGFAPDERFSIYRNNVLSRLSETLREAFPVVRQIVGPLFFDYAAHTFIEGHLPSEACLATYGTAFPTFLKSFSAVSQLPYLPDVARLELSISQVVRAAPEVWQPISLLRDLRGDPALVRLRLTQCVQFLASEFRIDQIWIAHQENSDSMNWHIDSGAANLSIHACESLRLNILPRGTWEFRSCLADGNTLGRATSVALNVYPEFDISLALASLFEEHLVVAIGDSIR